MKFFSEKLEDLLKNFFISDEFPALVYFNLHKFVYLIFSLHVFLQFELQIIDLVLSGLLMCLNQVRVIGLKVRLFLLLQHWKFRFFIK